MNIGDMNNRITVQSENRIIGAGGRPTVSYPTLSVVWASLKMTHHSPVMHGDKLDYPSEVIFTVHYDETLRAARRIIWDNATYVVLSVNDPGANRKLLEFRCMEKT